MLSTKEKSKIQENWKTDNGQEKKKENTLSTKEKSEIQEKPVMPPFNPSTRLHPSQDDRLTHYA